MQRCSKCILQSTLPSVKIEDDGVCNFCKTYKPMSHESRKENLKLMEQLFEKTKKEAWPYQVLLAYSGGKDSSYLLYHLKKEYNLNILAFSIIHPFLRDDTQRTMTEITKKIGVDLIKFHPQENVIKEVISQGLLNPEAYGFRESVGCSLCGSFHYQIPFVFAKKMGIPIVVTGNDPSQSVGYPTLSDMLSCSGESNNKPRMRIPHLPEKILPDIFGEDIINSIYQINEMDLSKQNNFPIMLNPLTIIDYDFRKKSEMMEHIGVVEQKKTHSLLSNCTVHHFFSYIAYEQYDCHPYEVNFSYALRQGYPTFVEQFARKDFKPSDPRQDTLKYLVDYKSILYLIVKNKNTQLDELFNEIKYKYTFLHGLLGDELLKQMIKDIYLVHHWAAFFKVDLETIRKKM